MTNTLSTPLASQGIHTGATIHANLGTAPLPVGGPVVLSSMANCTALIDLVPAAALAAGRSGASVLLVDEHSEPGGTLLSEPAIVIDGKPAWTWLADTLARIPDYKITKVDDLHPWLGNG